MAELRTEVFLMSDRIYCEALKLDRGFCSNFNPYFRKLPQFCIALIQYLQLSSTVLDTHLYLFKSMDHIIFNLKNFSDIPPHKTFNLFNIQCCYSYNMKSFEYY